MDKTISDVWLILQCNSFERIKGDTPLVVSADWELSKVPGEHTTVRLDTTPIRVGHNNDYLVRFTDGTFSILPSELRSILPKRGGGTMM